MSIPQHVAIIMDGNRRWAKKRGLPPIMGHKKGAKNLLKVVESAAKLGIKTLTVFAFSTENWNRPQEEVKTLMELLETYLFDQKDTMLKKGVKLNFIGNIEKCSLSLQKALQDVKEITKEGKNIELVLAINYGGRDEIVRACQKMLKEKINCEGVSEELFRTYLDCSQLSDPDLIIRTSGEMRISNFLLWEGAYSELIFVDTYWPSFSEKDLVRALAEYKKRKRRFGE